MKKKKRENEKNRNQCKLNLRLIDPIMNVNSYIFQPVFLSCGDETEDLEPIQFNIPASYSEKVKIHNW